MLWGRRCVSPMLDGHVGGGQFDAMLAADSCITRRAEF